ncbi:unnamed protein product [Linum trigynum]|uniref:Uncharacterized protein n=1 Tax=Linum trigynum TaxID=586398 RepID=A0AAV2EC59_9ROSI
MNRETIQSHRTLRRFTIRETNSRRPGEKDSGAVGCTGSSSTARSHHCQLHRVIVVGCTKLAAAARSRSTELYIIILPPGLDGSLRLRRV